MAADNIPIWRTGKTCTLNKFDGRLLIPGPNHRFMPLGDFHTNKYGMRAVQRTAQHTPGVSRFIYIFINIYTYGYPQFDSSARLLPSIMPSLDIQERYSFNQVRIRALKELAKSILVPPLLLSALIRASRTRLGYRTVPCYRLAIFLSAYARASYHDYLQGRDAMTIAGRRTIGMIPR